MRAFVAEGRLAAQSLVGRWGEAQFRPASDEPAFAALFPEKSPARTIASPIALSEADSTRAFGRHEDGRSGARAHFVIIADMKSRSIEGLNDEIAKLGPAFSILPQSWILSSDLSVNAIRNVLIQQLGKLDALIVIDASNDKAAWFNFGPEPDARIRRIWTKQHEPSAKLRRTG